MRCVCLAVIACRPIGFYLRNADLLAIFRLTFCGRRTNQTTHDIQTPRENKSLAQIKNNPKLCASLWRAVSSSERQSQQQQQREKSEAKTTEKKNKNGVDFQ